MKIAVLANHQQWEELKAGANITDCVRIHSQSAVGEEADAFVILNDAEFDFNSTMKPIIKNAVCLTLKEMNSPLNVVRVNGWNSFLKRSKWEVAGLMHEEIQHVFNCLGKQPTIVADEPGFVAARIIAMIINEAYFALGENISTKKEIDVAMRLGTNYPYGPFEWASLIGKRNILDLLNKLYSEEKRYQPSSLLIEEAFL